jgi:hypothetical protein
MNSILSIRRLFVLAIALILVATSLAPMQAQAQQDARFFAQTGYRVDNDAIWNYFQGRGGIDTFGYPVSRTFQFQGFNVQVFQRHVLQSFNAQARPLNLLDPELMPVTRINQSVFPPHDPAVAGAAPLPDAPNYGQAVQQHLAATVPNQWDGAAVGFRDYFVSAATPGAANRELVALEIWGFPTSQPRRDPGNLNFVYQRFQRGILLGDAFKNLLRGQDMPSDFAAEMAGSPFLALYDPQAPNGMAREVLNVNPPITRQNTNLSQAFVRQDATVPPERPPEAIMITQPGPGSRVMSPIRVAGEADPTFEQNLVVRVVSADGTELALTPTTIQSSLGQRGPFSTDVTVPVTGEDNVFIQVFSTSARDGGITHLSSVGVILTPTGPVDIRVREPHPETIAIFRPQSNARVQCCSVTVEGFGLAQFEQALVAEVLDENGQVVVREHLTVQAPDLGQPGPFQVTLPFTVTREQPGRIQVRDISPAFGGTSHLSSIEVTLVP